MKRTANEVEGVFPPCLVTRTWHKINIGLHMQKHMIQQEIYQRILVKHAKQKIQYIKTSKFQENAQRII